MKTIGLRHLLGSLRELKGAAWKALVLSILLQAFALAGPFYLLLVIDRGIALRDVSLVTLLAAAFGLLTVCRLATEWLRALVLISLRDALHARLVCRLYHHFIRLPMRWFDDRQVGEVASRFESTNAIKDMFAHELTAAVVDGTLAILSLAMMFVYSPIMTAVVLLSLAMCVGVNRWSFPALQGKEEELWQAQARERSHFIETTRAIQSIKLLAMESRREELWLARLRETLRRGASLERHRALAKMMDGTIGGLENIITIYIGATLTMGGTLTLGMFFAFMAYKMHFAGAADRLLRASTKYRMLDSHLQRIGEIALAKREVADEAAASRLRPLSGQIELRNVSFRYEEDGPVVLRNISLSIRAGDFVAITGPSGSGKSTLLKLILGLLEPRSGVILFDGAPARDLGYAAIRRQLGVVMQEDYVVAGTFAENISFFDKRSDLDWIRHCATLAGLDREVMEKPLKYDTPVPELGSTLSGGQRQRLLLARALYRRPKILLIDEGTSHLDIEKERELTQAIGRLDITRLLISHRPETIAAATRAYALVAGSLVPAGSEMQRIGSASRRREHELPDSLGSGRAYPS